MSTATPRSASPLPSSRQGRGADAEGDRRAFRLCGVDGARLRIRQKVSPGLMRAFREEQYPRTRLTLRHGARVILKSPE